MGTSCGDIPETTPKVKQFVRDMMDNGRILVLADVKDVYDRVRATPDSSPGAIRAIEQSLLEILQKYGALS